LLTIHLLPGKSRSTFRAAFHGAPDYAAAPLGQEQRENQHRLDRAPGAGLGVMRGTHKIRPALISGKCCRC